MAVILSEAAAATESKNLLLFLQTSEVEGNLHLGCAMVVTNFRDTRACSHYLGSGDGSQFFRVQGVRSAL